MTEGVNEPDLGVGTLTKDLEGSLLPVASIAHGRSVSKGQTVGRRAIVGKTHTYVDDDGCLQPTLNIFFEQRPGGISVDELWPDGAGEPKQRSALRRAAVIAADENHGIEGWAVIPVTGLLKHVSDVVRDVVHSPTATNEHHADVVLQNFLSIAENDPDKRKKANIASKALCDFTRSFGKIHPIPS